MRSWFSLGLSGLLSAQVTNATWAEVAVDKVGGYLQSKSVIIPKDSLMETGGQDSADTSETLIAIADGVGGFMNEGIDPGPFARLLTSTAIELNK